MGFGGGLDIGVGAGAGAGSGAQVGAAPAAQDPTVAAYLRALGFSDAQAQAESAKRIADVNAQSMFQQPEIDYQGQQALFNVGQDALGRGVYNSGERLMGEARAQHAQQFNTGKLQLNASQSIGDAQLTLARALADNEARRQTLLATAGAAAGGGAGYDYSAYG